MQVAASISKRVQLEKKQKKLVDEPALSLYNLPPSHNVSLDEFESYAIDRLQLLRTIEALRARNIKGSDFQNALKKAEARYMPMTEREQRQKDNTSHFILRLAYCKSEDLRRWFLQHECELFRFRFQQSDDGQIDAFMKVNNLGYAPISQAEKKRLEKTLINVYIAGVRGGTISSKIAENFAKMKYYRVPFTEVLTLVSRRLVYIEKGFAYVPRDQLITLLQGRFRASLSKELIHAFQQLPVIYDDKRISPLLRNVSKLYVGKNFTGNNAKGEVSAESVDGFANDGYMPACMNELHAALKRDHHLRHAGRMQYGLFLKGIGLPLDDALRFWQREFTKKITADVFMKSYAYNIRHNYGKEGKRADYSPYSCQKIILGAGPGHGEYHGCPYKEYDSNHLTSMLRKMKIDEGSISDIVESARTKNYQIACRKQFEARHKGVGDGVGNHPNAFFEAAQTLHGTTSTSSSSNNNNNNNNNNNKINNGQPLNNKEMENKTAVVPENISATAQGFTA